MNYLRIGTEYYKQINRPSISGDTIATIVKWKRLTIIDDNDKSFLNNIPKYEGFTVQPSHSNYQQEIKGFYNKYRPLNHNVSNTFDENKLVNTKVFLAHIFGEQLELGIDYLTLLWQRPLQILPILCLVSEERNTGKTTFLNWLKSIFQDNMTINKNEDFRSRFNSDWSEKLIIGVDEVLLDKKEDSERIKNLSTAQSYKTESKGLDKTESAFFGKFIMASNNETNFIYIDEKEMRYWVRKISPLTNVNPNFLEALQSELPEFVNFISNRNISTKQKTRMWFSKDQIKTEALDRLVYGTKFYFEKELILTLYDLFENFEVDELKLTNKDIVDLFRDSGQRVSRREITNIVVDKWNLESSNSSYFKYYRSINPNDNQWQVESTNEKGRHYTFEKVFIEAMLKS